MGAIGDLPYSRDLIVYAAEQRAKEKQIKLWQHCYPFMACKFMPFISLDEFVNVEPKKPIKSPAEIELEMLEIVKRYEEVSG